MVHKLWSCYFVIQTLSMQGLLIFLWIHSCIRMLLNTVSHSIQFIISPRAWEISKTKHRLQIFSGSFVRRASLLEAVFSSPKRKCNREQSRRRDKRSPFVDSFLINLSLFNNVVHQKKTSLKRPSSRKGQENNFTARERAFTSQQLRPCGCRIGIF